MFKWAKKTKSDSIKLNRQYNTHIIAYKDCPCEHTDARLKNNKHVKDDITVVSSINSRIKGIHGNHVKNSGNMGNNTQNDSLYSSEEFENFYNNEDSEYNYENGVKSSISWRKLNKIKKDTSSREYI